jgi:hypothetical protein
MNIYSKEVDEVIMLLTCILDVPGSNLYRDTILTGLSRLSSVFHGNSEIAPQIRSRTLPFKSFSNKMLSNARY